MRVRDCTGHQVPECPSLGCSPLQEGYQILTWRAESLPAPPLAHPADITWRGSAPQALPSPRRLRWRPFLPPKVSNCNPVETPDLTSICEKYKLEEAAELQSDRPRCGPFYKKAGLDLVKSWGQEEDCSLLDANQIQP